MTEPPSPLTMLFSRHTRRREFIALVGGAAAGWPVAGLAQQAGMPVIGFLNGRSPETSVDLLSEFRRGLADNGCLDGQNVAIEVRWARGEYDHAAAMAADLASRRVAVIVAAGTPMVSAAKAATTTIPIVFAVAVDPVEVGLVGSLNRPGGNLTGMTTLGAEVGPKRLELLHELIPTATIIAALVNPQSREASRVTGAAGQRGRTVHQHQDRQSARP